MLPCDYCHSKPAILFCRPDSAKLCLLCDQHVHAANALSLKHVRFQICDSCKTDTAVLRCSTDNLVLCHHCDVETHGAAASSHHQRHRLHGLSGCPSVTEIASALCLDFRAQDPVVPTAASGGRDEVYEQVLEIARQRNDDLGAEQLKFDESPINDVVVVDEMLMQQTPFTSLLMLPNSESEFDSRKSNDNNGYGTEAGDLLWNYNPAYQPPQVWDFQLQKSRDCHEPRVVTFDGLEVPKLFQDEHNMKYSTIGDDIDILSRNNQSDQSSSSHAKKKEENNKKAKGGLSSESKLFESIPYNGTNNVVVMEHLVGGNENVGTLTARVSLEELAKNRGDAMLRYKEKKKTRRYV
ncbi:hypothetical protein AAZX31_16G047900 [Glycine max]